MAKRLAAILFGKLFLCKFRLTSLSLRNFQHFFTLSTVGFNFTTVVFFLCLFRNTTEKI